jgi:hypothetical protein
VARRWANSRKWLQWRERASFLALLSVVTVTAVVGFVVGDRPTLPTAFDPPNRLWERSYGSASTSEATVVSDFDVIVRADGRRALSVGSLGITKAGLADQVNSATYLQKKFRHPIERIGVTATFTPPDPGANGGVVALLMGALPVPNDPAHNSDKVPDLAIHFSFSAAEWFMAMWDGLSGNGLVSLDSGHFPVPLTGDSTVEINRRGSHLDISLPNGSSRTYDDPRIASWAGNWAIWELYERNPGDISAAISHVWAR